MSMGNGDYVTSLLRNKATLMARPSSSPTQ